MSLGLGSQPENFWEQKHPFKKQRLADLADSKRFIRELHEKPNINTHIGRKRALENIQYQSTQSPSKEITMNYNGKDLNLPVFKLTADLQSKYQAKLAINKKPFLVFATRGNGHYFRNHVLEATAMEDCFDRPYVEAIQGDKIDSYFAKIARRIFIEPGKTQDHPINDAYNIFWRYKVEELDPETAWQEKIADLRFIECHGKADNLSPEAKDKFRATKYSHQGISQELQAFGEKYKLEFTDFFKANNDLFRSCVIFKDKKNQVFFIPLDSLRKELKGEKPLNFLRKLALEPDI